MSDPIHRDDGLYDFAPDPLPTSAGTKLKPRPIADSSAPVVLGYRTAKMDRPKEIDTDQIKNVYLPIGLLGGGVLIRMLSALIWSHHIASSFIELTIDLTLGTAVMLVAMLIAAKLRRIDLGKIHIAAYKLAAIYIAPSALIQFLWPIAMFVPLGGIICFVLQFALFFALLGALFDLDESDTWYCVCIMFVTGLGSFFIMRAVVG